MSEDTPSIEWRGTIPRAPHYDDLYYSADDPIGEVQHTFLDGIAFADLCGRSRVTIAETGFGTGLNFLLAWDRFNALAPSHAVLDFVSVEAHPMTRADLATAHGPFHRLAPVAQELRRQWPGAIEGVHRLSFDSGRVRLILLIGEAGAMLPRMNFSADAWFLDGFAPAKNPMMWRELVLREVARLSAPGAKIATFTAAGAVRRGLDDAGFDIAKRPGFGRKRDCLAGTRRAHASIPVQPPWTVAPAPLSEGARVAVVGDGIAGRAMAKALRQNGFSIVHIGGDRSAATSSASLPRALIAPKLTRGDQPFPVFWRQAFLDATRVLDDLDRKTPVWAGPRGLTIPPRGESGYGPQSALVAELRWPDAVLLQDIEAGLRVPPAGAVDTERLFEALGPPPSLRADIASLHRETDAWRLLDDNDAEVVAADAVVLACGAGMANMLRPFGHFGLRVGLGHAALMRTDAEIGPAILRDGYRTSADEAGRFIAGATAHAMASGASGASGENTASEEDMRAALRARIAPLVDGLDAETISIWRGLRCDTGDHLPLAGPVQDWASFAEDYDGLRLGKQVAGMPQARFLPGLYGLGALGARGFQGAFLLADHVAAMMAGRASPMTKALADAVAPARFQIRALRRNQGEHGQLSP